MDLTSSVLSSFRLTGGAFLRAELRAPFAIETLSGAETCAVFGRRYEHVIPYHVVMRGSCWARLPGETSVRAPTGTVLLFPRGEPHVLADDPGRRPRSMRQLLEGRAIRGPFAFDHGGAGDATQLVCGYLACERRRWNPLLESLPRLMAIDVGDGPLATWINSSLEYALLQSSPAAVGSDAGLARLSELLFVESLRRYMASLPADAAGWLAGIRDRHVGPALVQMHDHPAEHWTVDSLASSVGLSRSAFGARFQALLGVPPVAYLTRWRMQLAADLLQSTERSLLGVAMDVGYRSDAAFIRAFSRFYGTTPARWRRRGPSGGTS